MLYVYFIPCAGAAGSCAGNPSARGRGRNAAVQPVDSAAEREHVVLVRGSGVSRQDVVRGVRFGSLQHLGEFNAGGVVCGDQG